MDKLDNSELLRRTSYFSIVFAIFCVIVSNAWVTEDAYVSFRVLDNLINGHGLRWNITERVQAFTHPLWLLLHTPFYPLIGDAYFTTLLISVSFSVAAVVVAIRAFEMSPGYAFLFLLVPLVLSKAFVEYATSGLETPLTFFLIALFVFVLERKERMTSACWLFLLSLIAGLAALNRLDTLLLFFPLFTHLVFRYFSIRHLSAIALGFLPLMAWLLFSLFYFGFLFPNTAYAKLSTGIPTEEYVHQGISYALDLMRNDPASSLILGFSSGLMIYLALHALRYRASSSPQQLHYILMGLGGILYCLYIIRIGGDFMSGRLWSTPLLFQLLALAALMKGLASETGIREGLVGIILLLFFSAYLDHEERPNKVSASGIADERRWYLDHAGLLNYSRGNNIATHHHAIEGAEMKRLAEISPAPIVKESGSIGMRGYFSGSRVIWIDRFALTDPLLARLPITPSNIVFFTDGWRVGHYSRQTPTGYVHAVRTGETTRMDPALAAYYAKLRLIVSGPLFSLERLKTILLFNLGEYDHYLVDYIKRRNQGMG